MPESSNGQSAPGGRELSLSGEVGGLVESLGPAVLITATSSKIYEGHSGIILEDHEWNCWTQWLRKTQNQIRDTTGSLHWLYTTWEGLRELRHGLA